MPEYQEDIRSHTEHPERIGHQEPLDKDTLELAEWGELAWILRYARSRYQGRNVGHDVSPCRIKDQSIDEFPVNREAYESADYVTRSQERQD